MEPRNSLLDDFILELSGKRCPSICFLATAGGDAEGYIGRFYKAMSGRKCEASHLGLFTRTHLDPAKFLLRQNVIYVGGGNTANMLAIWRVHGVDRALRKAWRQGIVLAGISAGANCWFEACSTDSFGPLAPLCDGLGLLPGSVCPHYDGEKQRRPTLLSFIANGQLPGWPCPGRLHGRPLRRPTICRSGKFAAASESLPRGSRRKTGHRRSHPHAISRRCFRYEGRVNSKIL